MTHLRLAPSHYSPVHLHNTAVWASLAILLTVSSGCSGSETDKRPATKPSARVEEMDAGQQCERFDEDYRDAFKACTVDEDCEVADVEFSCHGAHGVFGVAKADRDEFDRCLPDPAKLRACPQGVVPVARADDGRVPAPDLRDLHARCVAGSCRAQIEDRSCGSSENICTGTQLCISFQDAMGATQFQCTDNPCGPQKLDCECAESVCSGPADKLRMCAVDLIDNADVYCKIVRR
jgi:hypothetical protein